MFPAVQTLTRFLADEILGLAVAAAVVQSGTATASSAVEEVKGMSEEELSAMIDAELAGG